MEYVILVDEKGEEMGSEEKVSAHLREGKLHKAFSVFVFNDKKELLVQKRSSSKKLWPGFWSNTCCSHPRPKEDIIQAGKRRIQEELGFSCELQNIGSFVYKAQFNNIGVEHEFCYVLSGEHSGAVDPDYSEVEEVRWIPWREIISSTQKEPSLWTPWMHIELEKFQRFLGN